MPSPSNPLHAEVAELFHDAGVELLDLSVIQRSGGPLVRTVADRRTGGLTIDDCARLTRELRNLIRERKLLAEDCAIEVSSPGLDYPLREEWQFAKNVGRLLKVNVTLEQRAREISGRLTAADGAEITLAADGREWRLPIAELRSIRILPEFKPPRTESKR